MGDDWIHNIISRLAKTARRGWGYGANSQPSAEPSALACKALSAHGAARSEVKAGLAFLGELQDERGAVPALPEIPSAAWPTALAVLAWSSLEDVGSRFESCILEAVGWLLEERGKTFESDPHIYGHNTQLSAWPWIDGTHSWIEPTCYALMALRATGYANHSRFNEGIELLRDRSMESGGWNYGNPRMFGRALRPFPATTGIALTALVGQRRDGMINRAISYLKSELPVVRAPISLAWGIIGLSQWGEQPSDAHEWLRDSAIRLLEKDPSPLEESLLLLAVAEDCPWGRATALNDIRIREMAVT